MRVFILDDEQPAVENLEILLQGHPDIQIIGVSTDSVEAVDEIRRCQPDVLFLDIQMPELDGFQVLERIRPISNPYVIFATAYDEFAIKAFESNALDYLLKPFDDSRFNAALKKAQEYSSTAQMKFFYEQIADLLADRPSGTKPYLQKVSVRERNRIRFIPVNEIIWFEADNQYVRVHTMDGAVIIRDSLNHLQEQLDPRKFYRSHRSAIIALEFLKSMEPYFKGDYWLNLAYDHKAKLSRSRSKGLRRLMSW
ncbi:MAG: response regulator transcription factor [Cyclobacteriaceae bacterium]|nr:response regulator transcription factor [Cyclobacteriaceae bacterium HetDA_MAG_MS6]